MHIVSLMSIHLALPILGRRKHVQLSGTELNGNVLLGNAS